MLCYFIYEIPPGKVKSLFPLNGFCTFYIYYHIPFTCIYHMEIFSTMSFWREQIEPYLLL